jgi:hypothetical protein
VSPAKARVEVRRVNDELARRLEGKSLVVGCTLDEVSKYVWPLQRRLQETRGICQSVLPINMLLHCPNGQGDLDPRNFAATPLVLPCPFVASEYDMLCAHCPDISPYERCEPQYPGPRMSRSFSRPTDLGRLLALARRV